MKLNLKWSLRDIDKIKAMAAKGYTAKDIAIMYEVPTKEMVALLNRNDIFYRA